MAALRPGQMLAGTSYEVVRQIGAGGMGVVYEIEHVRLKKRYVAKVIHDQVKHEGSAAKRMEREAQVLATLSHPNVVQVHDVGTTADGVSYFVMEKLEGVDLRRTMKSRGMSTGRSIAVISDVLQALDYLHRRGIVHRDVKPENIFLAEQLQGTVTKVLDFGIVHVVDGEGPLSQGRITKTGGFVGTLNYAAPEQMQGRPAGPPNDVYAAALVLFELIAGRGPFDDDPGVGLSRCFKAAPLLTEFVPTAPQELVELIARALDHAPDRRPTAGAFAAELRRIGAAMTSDAVESDPVRAEVDDLLRHMAPVAPSPPRPAVDRAPPYRAHDAGEDLGGTTAPKTPLMPDAPRSTTEAQTTSPELALALSRATSSTAEPPPSARGQTEVLGDAPQAPSPPGTDAAPGVGSAPESSLLSGEASTSPGLYATVDDTPIVSIRPPTGARRGMFGLAGAGVLLLVVLGIGVWVASRERGTSVVREPTTAAETPPGVVTAPAAASSSFPPSPTASLAPSIMLPSPPEASTPRGTAKGRTPVTTTNVITATSRAPSPVAPRPPSSAPRINKDGYVNTL